MSRRRKRKLIGYTDAERKELQRQDRNKCRRKQYAERRKREFYKEYACLCRRYKHFVGGCYGVLTGLNIRKDDDSGRLEYHLEHLDE